MRLPALFTIAMLGVGVVSAHGQALAEIARAEEARRKEVKDGSKVYTNDSLKPDFTRPAVEPGGPGDPASVAAPSDPAAPASPTPAAAPGAEASAPAPARDQAYWSGRMTEARSQVARSEAFATALQNRIDMLWTDFVNRDNPVERSAIELERNKALAELERIKQEIGEQTKAIAAIEDEARRAGVPPGWLRPS